jgi:hypothetical protein
MPIIFNSKLSSTVANATWLDKTIDDSTIGQLELANVAAASGATVTNTQREINLSRKVIFGEALKSAGDTLTPDSLSLNQEFRVKGNAAPVTLNILPFTGVKVVEDGCEIVIFGHDSTNTVTINHNDVAFGCLLNGNATLELGFAIKLVYNDELQRYIEMRRNF